MGIRRINFTEEELNSLKYLIAVYGEKNKKLTEMINEANKLQEDISAMKEEVEKLMKEEIALFDKLNKKYGGVNLAEIRAAVNPNLPY